MKLKKKAFTLMELLIVVIVLGVLAGIAVPKYARVLETRKTGEAEEVLNAVRTEQEKRCIMGKNYLDETKQAQLASLRSVHSVNYNYKLKDGNIEAQRPTKNYTLKMWYKTGEFCCEGSGCEKLNKDYPACQTEIVDECIELPEPIEPEVPDEPEEPGCEDYSFAVANKEQCCSPEYEHLWPSLCATPQKTCSDNDYFAENVEKCCKQGADRDECFDYYWETSKTVGDRCGKLRCTPLTGCGFLFVPSKCRNQYCEHKSGIKLLKQNGETRKNCTTGLQAFLDMAFGEVDSMLDFNTTGTQAQCSAFQDVSCNRENYNKSSKYFCQGAKVVLENCACIGGNNGIWFYRDYGYYNITTTQTCKRKLKTSF